LGIFFHWSRHGLVSIYLDVASCQGFDARNGQKTTDWEAGKKKGKGILVEHEDLQGVVAGGPGKTC